MVRSEDDVNASESHPLIVGARRICNGRRFVFILLIIWGHFSAFSSLRLRRRRRPTLTRMTDFITMMMKKMIDLLPFCSGKKGGCISVLEGIRRTNDNLRPLPS